MNSIKFYLENYIKENPNRKGLQKKLFVFMIHLFRIEREFKQEVKHANEEKLKEKEKEEKEKEKNVKESKIIKNETLISHLADCNQIFIDNINGLNVNFIVYI